MNTDTEILISQFLPADHTEAVSLWQRTPGVGLSRADEFESIAQFLSRNPGTSFVAKTNGRLVGTILCGHDGRRGLIHHLVTSEENRRRGIGTKLLHAGLDALRSAGIQKCHLLVFRDNEVGLNFWRGVQAKERHELALFSLTTEIAA